MSAYVISRRVVLLGVLPAACGLAAAPPLPIVPTLAALRTLPTAEFASGKTVRVTQAGVGGRFIWDPAAFARDDGLFAIAPASGRRGRWLRDTSDGIDVRWFGASPTASAAVNTAAFAEASAAINRAGGGTLRVPPGTYRVGTQALTRARGRGNAYVPADIIKIDGCSDPVALLGTGAVLKAADGMRFGSFDPMTGAPHRPRMPFTDRDYRSDAATMIQVHGCTGSVRIEGFELDGNAKSYAIGGEWGDTGRQVGGDGVILGNNSGGVRIINVVSRDHGRDGMMIGHGGLTPSSPRYPVALTNVTCTRNGRQGLSWVGGTELTATNCSFTRTGRGTISSAPGAGVDIEAEDSVCRNGRFVNCKFVDNAGVGMVADSGDSADVVFEGCEFIGTTAWSAWPTKPGFVFRKCLFVGSIVQVHGDPDPRRATQFISCRFYGDPKLSPTGKVYGNFLGDLGAGATNVLMKDCDFRAVAPGIALLWSPGDIRFEDCRFRQAGPNQSYPRGIFSGVNRIDSAGPVGLEGSRNTGKLFLNGKPV